MLPPPHLLSAVVPDPEGAIVVIGAGAQDSEDELGGAVLAATRARGVVRGLDLRAADPANDPAHRQDVLASALGTMHPSSVLLVDEDVEVPACTAVAPSVVRVSRAEAVVALWTAAGAGSVAAAPTAAPTARDRLPRVSVLVPVFEHEEFLDATLQSLVSQDFEDFEVVLLDDGSRDRSLQVLRHYERSDPRVRVLNQQNVGHTGRLDVPFDRLVRAARGELLAWLGGDDVSLPGRLTAQVAAFDDDPQLDVCHGAADAVGTDGDYLGLVWNLEQPYDDLSALRVMATRNVVGAPSVMMRRSVFDRVGSWEEGLTCDYHFWLKSAGRARFRYLPRRLVGYRQHARSLSTSEQGQPRAHREGLRVRALVVQRRGLAEFYPELAGEGDPRVWSAAGLALGNSLLQVDAALALHAYDLAIEAAGPCPELHHSRALAQALTGDLLAARASARAAGPHPASRQLLRAVAHGEADLTGVGLRTAHDRLLTAALARGRRSVEETARRWDGSRLGTARAYVGLDVQQPELTAAALSRWCEATSPDDDVTWVLPVPVSQQALVLAHLVDAAQELDVSAAGSIVLEDVDALGLLPPEADRLTGVLGGPADIDVFSSWLAGRTQ